MMELRRKRPWSGQIFLVVIFGYLQVQYAYSADYYDGPSRGDDGSYNEPISNANLGFDDVQRRHDGYVKGEVPTIPQTSFSCGAQPYNPGLYADMETNCQVYHVCFDARQESFLCGPGTNFNQKILACDFWYNFNCQESPSFYNANADIGKVPDTAYRQDQSSGGHRDVQRPSFPSYPQEQRPVQPPPPPPRQPPPPPPPPPRPQPPRIPQPSAQPPRVRPPTPQRPPVHQVLDTGYEPQRPISVSPPQRPAFPPVVSPPRVTRPPVQHPVVVRRPAESAPPPRRPARPPVHPDANIKGSDYRPPRPQPPRIPQPSQPVDTGFPAFPSRPIQRPPPRPEVRRPQPPTEFQQEHVDYVPPPAPKPPTRPVHVPPPPPPPRARPPIQQEVLEIKPDYVRPPAPSGPSGEYVPPPPPPPPRRPPPQRPLPPSVPSFISEERRRPSPPPPPPQRPRPVFPPVSDHPNANIKGGPGYRQPSPAQLPSYEATRITHRPSGSTSHTGYQPPPPPPAIQPHPRPQPSDGYEPPISPPAVKRPAQTVHRPGYKRPQPPAQATDTGYKPPLPRRPPAVIDHPGSSIKGGYVGPPAHRQPTRVISPATAVTSVKRPQPPSLPSTSIKTARPSSESHVFQQQLPVDRVKIPSQTTETRHVFPSPRPQPIDHPNANIKGGPGYQQPRPQPSRPIISHPPAEPSIPIQRKTVLSHERQGQASGRGYQPVIVPQQPYHPRGDEEYHDHEEVVHQQVYEPQRHIRVADVKRPSVKRPAPSQQTVLVKQPQEYDIGTSYKRGPEYYPKPEFQQSVHPVSTPSRSSHIASQTRLAQQSRPPAASHGTGQSNYPYDPVPGHQPPHQAQVFPHRDNPDHPNESIKGTNAYRPPPPADYQAAASETQEQKVEDTNIEGEEDSSSKLGDTGME